MSNDDNVESQADLDANSDDDGINDPLTLTTNMPRERVRDAGMPDGRQIDSLSFDWIEIDWIES